MPDYSLHAITKEDEPFLWDMLYLDIYVPEGEQRPPREILSLPEIAQYVWGWGQPGDLGYIAVENETHQRLGAAWLRLIHGYGYVDEQTPELSIALLPEYRGMGIGTALLTGLLETARDQFAAVSLSVDPRNPAKRLYERLGFRVVGQDGTSLTMKKEFL